MAFRGSGLRVKSRAQGLEFRVKSCELVGNQCWG